MTSKSLRFQVLQEAEYTCAYCGQRAPEVRLEVDHVVPRSKGGSDDRSNLVCACYDCNHGKRDIDGILPPVLQGTRASWPVGAFFHYLNDDGYTENQGRIRRIDGDTAWVELFNFVDGYSDGAEYARPIGDWSRWKLYTTPEAMRRAYVLEGALRGWWPLSELQYA